MPGVMAVSDREFASLETLVKSFMAQWERQDKAAGLRLDAMSGRLDNLTLQIVSTDLGVQEIKRDISELNRDIKEDIKPVIEGYKLEKAAQNRLSSFGKAVWVGIAGLLAAAVGAGVHHFWP